MNKLPNKNILWWAPAYTPLRIVKNIFLTVDTVLGYDKLTKDWSITRVNNTIGVPAGTEEYTIICNNANPYIRLHKAWRQDCLKRYKAIPTLEQWINTQINVRTSSSSGTTADITVSLSAEIAKTGKTPTYYLRTESLEADLAALSFINVNSKQVKNILSDVDEGEKNTLANLLLEDKITNTNSIDLFANWKTHYNQALADLVYNTLSADFDYFNYDRDSWK